MVLRRKRPGRPRLSCFERPLRGSLYSYVRGIARVSPAITTALAGALFRLGLGANGTTILGVATSPLAGFAFARSSTIAGVLLLGTRRFSMPYPPSGERLSAAEYYSVVDASSGTAKPQAGGPIQEFPYSGS